MRTNLDSIEFMIELLSLQCVGVEIEGLRIERKV
jgi:hypothetical protein